MIAEGLAYELVDRPVELLAPLRAVLDSVAADTSEFAFIRAQGTMRYNHDSDKFLRVF
jgi:hypothetical protein